MRTGNQLPGWVWLMIIFFFGTSLLGIGGTFLTYTLGLPYTWTSFLGLPLLGVAFWLFYKGYPLDVWLLAGCVAVALILSAALIRGFTVKEPSLRGADRDFFTPEDQENLSMFGTFLNVNYYGDYDNDIAVDETHALISNNDLGRTILTLQFAPVITPNGEWYYKDGTVQMQGGLNGSYRADAEENWTGIDNANLEPPEGFTMQPAFPYLNVSLPITRQTTGQPITLNATLTIAYPIYDEGEPHLEEQRLTRTVDVMIPSTDFFTYQTKYDEWRRSRRVVEAPGIFAVAAGNVLAIAGALVLIWRGALQARPGGFNIEIRRLNGVQRLGAEAHALKNLSSDAVQGLTEGVFLGPVEAQSPAGRAGIQSGDILVAFAGKPIGSPRELNRAASRMKRGEVAQVTVVRNGQPLDIFVKF